MEWRNPLFPFPFLTYNMHNFSLHQTLPPMCTGNLHNVFMHLLHSNSWKIFLFLSFSQLISFLWAGKTHRKCLFLLSPHCRNDPWLQLGKYWKLLFSHSYFSIRLEELNGARLMPNDNASTEFLLTYIIFFFLAFIWEIVRIFYVLSI